MPSLREHERALDLGLAKVIAQLGPFLNCVGSEEGLGVFGKEAIQVCRVTGGTAKLTLVQHEQQPRG